MSLWMCQHCARLQGYNESMRCPACGGVLQFTTVAAQRNPEGFAGLPEHLQPSNLPAASSVLPSASLDAIKKRFKEHYSRGIGEPIGLPRETWMEDTADLIAEIERLNAIATSASLEQLQRYKGVGIRGYMVPADARGIYDPATDSCWSTEHEWVKWADVLALLRHADPQDQP